MVHDLFDLEGLLLERVEVVAKNLDAELRANAGREHEQAVLDRLEKARHVAGNLRELRRQFGNQLVPGQPRTPVGGGFEHDGRLDHFRRRRIGGGVETAELPRDRCHLRGRTNDAVLPRHDPLHLSHGRARQQHGHEEQ